MADEIIVSSAGDLTLAAALSTKYLLLLADRNALPNHPALVAGYAGSVSGRGSSVLKVSHVGLMGYDLLVSGTDGSTVANTALTDNASTITVTPWSKVYERSDLVAGIRGDLLGQDMMAMDAVVTASATKLSAAANLVDNFSTTVGSSGVNATFANYLEAIALLEIAKVQGPYLAILHPRQWADIRADVATASGGAIQFNAGSQQVLDRMKGLGYQGVFCGADVWTTAHVPTANAGADRAGGIFGAGALVWADMAVPVEPSADAIPLDGGKVLFERDRSARAQLTAWVTTMYFGIAEGIDASGVSVITDA